MPANNLQELLAWMKREGSPSYASQGPASTGQLAMELLKAMAGVNADGAAIYKYLNFNQIEEYVENAKGVTA